MHILSKKKFWELTEQIPRASIWRNMIGSTVGRQCDGGLNDGSTLAVVVVALVSPLSWLMGESFII